MLQEFPFIVEHMLIDTSRVWFVPIDCAILFCWNLVTSEIEMAEKLPEEQVEMSYSYTRYIKYKDKLVLVPNVASKILFYYEKTRKFRELVIKELMEPGAWSPLVIFSVSHYAYIIFSLPKQILVLDMENEEIVKLISIPWLQERDSLCDQWCICSDQIIMAVRNESKIISYSIKEERFSLYPIDCNLEGFWTLCYDGKDIWLSGLGSEVVSWNPDKRETGGISQLPQELKVFGRDRRTGELNSLSISDFSHLKHEFEAEACFMYSYFDGMRVWFIPYQASHLVTLEMENAKMKLHQVQLEDLHKLKKNEGHLLLGAGATDKTIWILSRIDYGIYKINTYTGKIQKEKLIIRDKNIIRMVLKLKINENKRFGIQELIRIMC